MSGSGSGGPGSLGLKSEWGADRLELVGCNKALSIMADRSLFSMYLYFSLFLLRSPQLFYNLLISLAYLQMGTAFCSAKGISCLQTRFVLVPISKEICLTPGGRWQTSASVSKVYTLPVRDGLKVRWAGIHLSYGVPILQISNSSSMCLKRLS